MLRRRLGAWYEYASPWSASRPRSIATPRTWSGRYRRRKLSGSATNASTRSCGCGARPRLPAKRRMTTARSRLRETPPSSLIGSHTTGGRRRRRDPWRRDPRRRRRLRQPPAKQSTPYCERHGWTRRMRLRRRTLRPQPPRRRRRHRRVGRRASPARPRFTPACSTLGRPTRAPPPSAPRPYTDRRRRGSRCRCATKRPRHSKKRSSRAHRR